jgi:small subunit ribosomal protein S5
MSRDRRFKTKREKPEYDQKLLDLARVTRVVKGGRRFRFRAVLVIGNKKGRVGVGVGKGADVSDAIKKAFEDGRKKIITIKTDRGTIPHDVYWKQGSAKVILKPARTGRGIVAGGAVRAVVEMAGIKDIVSKSLGTSNKLNVARAALFALGTFGNSRNRDTRIGKEVTAGGNK